MRGDRQPPNRLRWLDVAKGLGILMIVLGHVLGVQTGLRLVEAVLWTAHVPLFFFLAGAVPGRGRDAAIAGLAAEARRLLVPYAGFSLVAIGLHAAPGWPTMAGTVPALLGEALHGTADAGRMAYDPPLWFLTCLFCVFLLGRAVEAFAGAGIPALAGSLLAAGGLRMSGLLDGITLPWNADVAVMALPYFLAGRLAGQHLVEEAGLPGPGRLGLALAACAAVTAAVVALNGRVDMNLRIYGNVWLFQAGALAGIGAVTAMAILLRRAGLLAAIGQASLTIMATHALFLLHARPVMKPLAWYAYRATGSALFSALLVTAVLTALGLLIHRALLRTFPATIDAARPRPSDGPLPHRPADRSAT